MSRFSGLDPNIAEHRSILDDLQMGILKGHGRAFSSYIFFRFGHEQSATFRIFIKSLPRGSSFEQFHQARTRNALGNNQFYYSVSLSCTGMSKLGISPRDQPADVSFRNGMKWASSHVLHEDAGPSWIPFFKSDIDALLVVANDDPHLLASKVDSIVQWQRSTLGTAETYVVQASSKRSAGRSEAEHFGFADGISQPLFLKDDIDTFLSTSDPIRFDPTFDPRDLVLVPFGASRTAFGSFMAARLIEQDVDAFASSTASLANAGGIAQDAIQAQVVGRHKDGTSLALHATPVGSSTATNNFDYADDPRGAKCPLHAHVRKMNQRDADETAAYHWIARRGVLFDELPDRQARGLLFICYQADLGRQFEFLQSRWAADPDFPPPVAPGTDPLLISPVGSRPQRWNRDWGSTLRCYRQGLAVSTTFRGGEYLFTPPNSFLQSL